MMLWCCCEHRLQPILITLRDMWDVRYETNPTTFTLVKADPVRAAFVGLQRSTELVAGEKTAIEHIVYRYDVNATAPITSARMIETGGIAFYATNEDPKHVRFRVYGVADPNWAGLPTFSQDPADYENLPRTSAYASFDYEIFTPPKEIAQVSLLEGPINEVMQLPGWTIGNPVGLIVEEFASDQPTLPPPTGGFNNVYFNFASQPRLQIQP